MAGASRKGLVNSASFIDSHPARQGSRSLHCLWALGCSPVEYRRTCGHIEFYLRETGTHINKKLGENRQVCQLHALWLSARSPGRAGLPAPGRAGSGPEVAPAAMPPKAVFVVSSCSLFVESTRGKVPYGQGLFSCSLPTNRHTESMSQAGYRTSRDPKPFLAAVTKETASSLSSSHSQVHACCLLNCPLGWLMPPVPTQGTLSSSWTLLLLGSTSSYPYAHPRTM